MKPYYLLISATLLTGVGGVWLLRLRAEGLELSSELEHRRVVSKLADEAHLAKVEAASAERIALTRRLAEVTSQLAVEQKTNTELTAQKSELESKLPPVDEDEIVVSFGRIRDMAAELGDTARLCQKLMSGKMKSLTPEDNERLMASVVKIMAWMPEIAAFEDTPSEISCLQSETISKAFDLDAATTARIGGIIRDHFTQMKAMGVTAGSQDRPGWRDRRSSSLTQLMWKLRPLIPVDSEVIESLPFIVNLGSGMERHVDLKLDEKGESHGTVRTSLPNWPRVPWLQEK